MFYQNLQDMVERYAADLTIPEEEVVSACEHLRKHALSKLNARSKFQSTGLATIKVKVAAGASVSYNLIQKWK